MKSYECSVCNTKFETAKERDFCQSKNSISHKTTLNIGDKVKVRTGDGAGEFATISKKVIFDCQWGHVLWKRYWHTEGLIVDFGGGYGRMLTYDDYYNIKLIRNEKMKKIKE
jgi:hypothetical protein